MVVLNSVLFTCAVVVKCQQKLVPSAEPPWSPRIKGPIFQGCCRLLLSFLPIDQDDGDDGDGDEDGGECDGEDEVEVGPADEAEGLQVGRRAGALAVGARASLEARPGGLVARRQRFVEEL